MALMLLESYCSVGDAGAGPDGPQKTQLHAGPSMQFPWEPPKRMQSFWHFFGLHLSPNLRTVGLHLSLLLLSMDDKPSSAKLRKKLSKQQLCGIVETTVIRWQCFVTAIGAEIYVTTAPWGQGSGELGWPSSWIGCW